MGPNGSHMIVIHEQRQPVDRLVGAGCDEELWLQMSALVSPPHDQIKFPELDEVKDQKRTKGLRLMQDQSVIDVRLHLGTVFRSVGTQFPGHFPCRVYGLSSHTHSPLSNAVGINFAIRRIASNHCRGGKEALLSLIVTKSTGLREKLVRKLENSVMIEEMPGGTVKLQCTLRDGGAVRPRMQDTQVGLAALVSIVRGTCPRSPGAEVRATVCTSGSMN